MTAQGRPRARSLRLAGASSTVKMSNRPWSRSFRFSSVQGLRSGSRREEIGRHAGGSLDRQDGGRQALPQAELELRRGPRQDRFAGPPGHARRAADRLVAQGSASIRARCRWHVRRSAGSPPARIRGPASGAGTPRTLHPPRRPRSPQTLRPDQDRAAHQRPGRPGPGPPGGSPSHEAVAGPRTRHAGPPARSSSTVRPGRPRGSRPGGRRTYLRTSPPRRSPYAEPAEPSATCR